MGNPEELLKYATQFTINGVVIEKRSADNWVVITEQLDKKVIDAPLNEYDEPAYTNVWEKRDSYKTELGKKTQFPLDVAFELANKWLEY